MARVDAFLCSTGYEAALVAEIGATASTPCPGVVVGEAGGADLVFGRQILPDAVWVQGASVSSLARGVVEHVLQRLDAAEQPWRLDTLVADDPGESLPGELARRAALCAERALEALRARRTRVLRRRTEDPAALRVQLLLVDRERLLLSVAAPVALPGGDLWPSPLVAGRAPVADDWDAPSSAFRKLEEALRWHDRPIQAGERCIDLGAAPGGWSHVALRHGAAVTAVDRADLDPRLMARPDLKHLRRDAFGWTPEDVPVDWLLCDVIAAPEKSLALLERWARERWFRRACFHLKFKGQDRYGLARSALDVLRAAGYSARAKHLFHDKNEVTLLARR